MKTTRFYINVSATEDTEMHRNVLRHGLTQINTVFVFVCIFSLSAFAKDISDRLKDSVVYLQLAYHSYEQYTPWKTAELAEGFAVGCAVDTNRVITIASSVADAAFIQARKAGQNDFIPAKILAVDYESNLALLELDSNSLARPLRPLSFSEKYKKGEGVNFYWLSADGQMYNGRGFLDRVTVESTSVFYSQTLTFVAAGISENTNLGQLYCLGESPIGIASLSGKEKEGNIIPAKLINRFLSDFRDGRYNGIAMKGFETSALVDPSLRKYLKLPDNMHSGTYVSDVFTIGTGSDVLKAGDVLLAIDGYSINPYGRYTDLKFGELAFDCLITSKSAGDGITFEIWRDGRKQFVQTTAKRFDAADMLIPWYEFDTQPQYAIIGGCILQKLTKNYLAARGDDWQGKVSSHLYNYLLNDAFKPTQQRREIVILSYCMPARINIGYQDLSQLVVEKINGMKIGRMSDIPKAMALNPDSKFVIIEFEMSGPAIVLDKNQLDYTAASIAKIYGIEKMTNIK